MKYIRNKDGKSIVEESQVDKIGGVSCKSENLFHVYTEPTILNGNYFIKNDSYCKNVELGYRFNNYKEIEDCIKERKQNIIYNLKQLKKNYPNSENYRQIFIDNSTNNKYELNDNWELVLI